jgi:hypothetical protein
VSALTWRRTGDDDFPVAAQDGGHWLVLRRNESPEHPSFTMFRDGLGVRDIEEWPTDELGKEPDLFAAKLQNAQRDRALASVRGLRRYGAEHGDPCDSICCTARDED